MNPTRALGIALMGAVFMLGAGPSQGKMPDKPRDNPFLLPEGVYPEGKVPPGRVERLTLRAILSVDGIKIAIINNRNFTVGDVVFDRKVVEILEDRVVLVKKGVKSVLTLRTPQFPVRVRNQK